MPPTDIEELEREIKKDVRDFENVAEEQISEFESGMLSRRDQGFIRFKNQVLGKIKDLEQKLGDYNVEDLEYDLIQPYERDVSSETRPQLSTAGLDENNKHLTQLSNHELHQMKSIHEEDHRKPIRTVLDEPLGEILDNCINFLANSYDSIEKKKSEAELMEHIHSGDKIGYYDRFKIYLITIILFFREDRNIIYIGFLLIFLSIIIYFTNIITTAG